MTRFFNILKNLTVLFIVSLSACAERAANIEPSYISGEKYTTWDCHSLIKEKSFVDNALSQASANQDVAADNDALMVFLIGVPTSGGGIKSEVARLKGEQEALRGVIRDKDCGNNKSSLSPITQPTKSKESTIEKIKALQVLKSTGSISDEEYNELLKKLLQ